MGTGTGQTGKSYFAKREREQNQANKEVFDWLLKNNKNAAFAIISQFDWLLLDFPVSMWEKVELNSTNGHENCKISNCACLCDNFPVPVAKQTSGNPP